MSDREEYINGLRAFANLLENSPDLPVPTHGGTTSGSAIQWLLFGVKDDLGQKATAAQIIRGIPGQWEKYDTFDLFRARSSICGLHFEIVVDREVVCTRKVVGTKKVTKQVAVKHEEIEVDEDIVEWDCGSLLKPSLAAGRPQIERRTAEVAR